MAAAFDDFVEQFIATYDQNQYENLIELLVHLPSSTFNPEQEFWIEKFSPIISRGPELIMKVFMQPHGLVTPEPLNLICKFIDCLTLSVDAISKTRFDNSLSSSHAVEYLQVLKSIYISSEFSSEYKTHKGFQQFCTSVSKFEKVLSFLFTKCKHSKAKKDIPLVCDLLSEILDAMKQINYTNVKQLYFLGKIYESFFALYHLEMEKSVDYSGMILLFCRLNFKYIDFIENLKEAYCQNSQAIMPLHDFVELIKLFSGFLKILCRLWSLNDQDEVTDIFSQVFLVILKLYGLIIIDLSKEIPTVEFLDTLCEHLTVFIIPLLISIQGDHIYQFIMDNNSVYASPELHVSYCLAMLTMLSQQSQCSFCDQVHEKLLKSLLEVIAKIKGKEIMYTKRICVPSYLRDNQNENSMRFMSLYEYFLQKICFIFKNTCAIHFNSLEKILLSHLLSRRQILSFLICDAWCCIIRYSPPEVCYQHCLMLKRLLKIVADIDINFWVYMLLQRIFCFLNEQQKNKIQSIHSDLHIFGDHGQCMNPGVLFFLCDCKIDELQFRNSAVNRLYHLQHFLESESMPKVAKSCLEEKTAVTLLRTIVHLIPPFPVENESDGERLKKIIDIANRLWHPEKMSIVLTVLTLLNSMDKLFIAQSVDQKLKQDILTDFSNLFLKMLMHSDQIICNESIYILAKLAFYNCNKEIILKCKMVFPDLLEKVKNYLVHKMNFRSEEDNWREWKKISSLLKQYPKYTSHRDKFDFSLAHSTLRFKLAVSEKKCSVDSQLDLAISSLSEAYERIQSLRNISPSSQERIREYCQHIVDST